jgi:hypothetical protein
MYQFFEAVTVLFIVWGVLALLWHGLMLLYYVVAKR